MALQLILGGSGAGKTRQLYQWLIQESIDHPDQQYYTIVPEQYTMQTQKEIVELHPHHGVMNVDILSFARLAYRVFEELAVVNPTVLDDMGKSMVLRKVAANKKKELVMFQKHLDKTGFINQLKSMLSELYQYGITPEDLDLKIGTVGDHPLLEQKMKDLSVIYHGFKEYIENRYATAEEILEILCRILPRSQLLKDTVMTLDGFTGFTPIQYRLLELFLIHCRLVVVTVTIDPGLNPYVKGKIQELFYMSRSTVNSLTTIAKEQNVEIKEAIKLNHRPLYRFVESEALDYLEQNFLRYPSKSYHKEQDSICLIQAASIGKEVERTVEEILRLVKYEGYRYRDIAVITGDLAGYSEKLIHQFETVQIPYFLDQKKNMISNPMVELIRSALEVIQKDFSYESVFRYLKTGLVTEDWDMIYRLENYVIALGIRGFKRWNQEWTMVYYKAEEMNLEKLNGFRIAVLEPLLGFREVMRDKKTNVQEMTAAVITLLEQLQVEKGMLRYEAQFTSERQHSLAKEYSQVYGLVMELADRLVSLLGDEVILKKEYADILDAGFQEIKVGLIPAAVDRVVVGDITRTRIDHVKALFFLGVNDGIIPSSKGNEGVLTDREREFLKQHQMELAPTVKEDGFMQKFYLYLMMTKPSHKLYLSYAMVSSDGKSRRPSYLIGMIKKIFPGIKVLEEQEKLVLSAELGKQKLIYGLKEIKQHYENGEFWELFRWYYQSDQYHQQVERLVEAAFYTYQEKGISKAAAKALYGNILSGSVTRLEQYAACAYAHFLRYGLELVERREYELAAVDIGNLFHNSIDLFFKEMGLQGRDWNTLTQSDRKELVRDCVSRVAEQYGNTILQSSARNAYLARRVERITDRTIWALGEQIKKGDFVPADFEVSFSAIDNLNALKISLSEEEHLQLRGRIDRMDTCVDGECVYVKIIDYKSGGTSFDLTALYYGLQLQLVVYMDAVLEMEARKHPEQTVVPAGIFYYNINDPLVDKQVGMTQEDIDSQILKQLKMNGLVNSDLEVIRHLDRTIETESDVIPVVLKSGMVQESRSSVAGGGRFDSLRGFVQGKLKTSGREILRGDTETSPYKQGNKTACDYCVYHPVCGFDLKTPGFGFRHFKAMKSEEIWNEIEGGGKDESGVDKGSAESN